MNKNLSHIAGTFAIALSNPKIAAFFVLFNIGHLIAYIQSDEVNKFTTYILAIVGFLGIPLIYGLFFEKIYETEKSSISELAKKYLLKFYGLTILIAIPLASVVILNIFTKSSVIIYAYFIVSLAISVAEIYILPHFFKTTKIIESIKQGLYFLKNNLKTSQTLIGMTLAIAIINHYLEYYLYDFGEKITLIRSLFGFTLSLLETILMFSIFILATITYRSLDEK